MIAELMAFLEAQPMFTGLVGATLTGALLFALRQVPAKLWSALREVLSVTLVLDSDEEAYHHVSVWLARTETARRARRLMVTEAYDYDLGRWATAITLGAGWHLVHLGGRLVFVHRHVQDPEALDRALGGRKRHRLTLISPGVSQAPLRGLLEAARAAYFGDGLMEVLFWAGGFEVADKRPKRPLDTVFLPEAQKARLVTALTDFLGARETYRRRGVPWRLGMLLEGPPGTGKSTLIQVLAGLIGRSVYVVNLASVGGDNDLIRAVNAVGPNGVLVLEDIDGVRVTRDRQAQAEVEAAAPAVAVGTAAPEARGVTLSGVLNAIDGVTARDGRILIMTSNHPEQLDAALLRPGRVDVRERIDRLDRPEALAMFRAFHPDAPESAFERLVGDRLPLAAAELQNAYLGLGAGEGGRLESIPCLEAAA